MGTIQRAPAAWAKVYKILAEIETEWRARLGAKRFNELKDLLCEVWVSDLVR